MPSETIPRVAPDGRPPIDYLRLGGTVLEIPQYRSCSPGFIGCSPGLGGSDRLPAVSQSGPRKQHAPQSTDWGGARADGHKGGRPRSGTSARLVMFNPASCLMEGVEPRVHPIGRTRVRFLHATANPAAYASPQGWQWWCCGGPVQGSRRFYGGEAVVRRGNFGSDSLGTDTRSTYLNPSQGASPPQ